MTRRRTLLDEYGSLGLLLFLVTVLTATVIASCGGGGGGGSDGQLCDQCGVSPDGPCQGSAFVVPGATQPEDCPSPDTTNPNGCVQRGLICRRRVDSAQQRCYPVDPSTDPANPQPDFQFRCDGSRPGGTAVPEPTMTPTPTGAVTATPGICGDGIRESNEECDSFDLAGQSCASLCNGGSGILACNADCTFNVNGCTGICTAP